MMKAPCRFVIFGATGHLATTKLLPALYHLELSGKLDASLAFTAFARRDWDTARWRAHVAERLAEEVGDAMQPAATDRFVGRFDYVAGDHRDPDAYRGLFDSIRGSGSDSCENTVFYLAIPPDEFVHVVRTLDAVGLNSLAGRHRIVVEKPFGKDLASAGELNAELHLHFTEEQIYRIDHYLGKEAVQNLLVFRFANSVIEPLWNRNHIDHVQITVAETAGIGTRAGYFDRAGSLRDMVQNHLLQVLTLVAMEPPSDLGADSLRDEKAKVLRSIRPIPQDAVDDSALRGQYGAGRFAGKPVPAYREESDVPRASRTESYAAIKLHIDNWRWRGVPFYLRTGKRLAAQRSLVAIRFLEPPHQLFRDTPCANADPNWLLLSIHPEERIRFELYAREPGLDMTPRLLKVDTDYRAAHEKRLDAYATLLLDVIKGDRSLFIRFDEVEMAWRVIEPVLRHWQETDAGLHIYPAGSWGPPESAGVFEQPHQAWRDEL